MMDRAALREKVLETLNYHLLTYHTKDGACVCPEWAPTRAALAQERP